MRFLHRNVSSQNTTELDPPYDIVSGTPTDTTNIGYLTDTPPDPELARKAWVADIWQAEPAERGPFNLQQFQSGHTSIVPTNPADEQGMGRAPGWRWAHLPHVQQFDPIMAYNFTFMDGGGFHGFSERVQRSPIWPEGYLHYTQQPGEHQWWPHVATVNQPEVPAFTEFVPPIQ